MLCKVEVMNMNDLPDQYEQYIVARLFSNQLWFLGSYSSQKIAYKAAKEIGGIVLEIVD